MRCLQRFSVFTFLERLLDFVGGKWMWVWVWFKAEQLAWKLLLVKVSQVALLLIRQVSFHGFYYKAQHTLQQDTLKTNVVRAKQ